MKLSGILYESARDLWIEATEKPFVNEMAKGTLAEHRFRNYMLQDYMYLLDYIDILKLTQEGAEDSALRDFLTGVIRQTTHETECVHLPNMKRIGVSEEEIAACRKSKVISDYVAYMRKQLEMKGTIAGLTALLQCSWAYAYIGQVMNGRYAEEILTSPYRSWFDSYVDVSYVEANQRWIDMMDRQAGDLKEEEVQELCRIFRCCAEHENLFWDALYNYR